MLVDFDCDGVFIPSINGNEIVERKIELYWACVTLLRRRRRKGLLLGGTEGLPLGD